MNLLITGANGFVGLLLCHRAIAHPAISTIYAAVRSTAAAQTLPQNVQPIQIQDLTDLTHTLNLLYQVEVIVHLAARVHQLSDPFPDAYKTINTDATLALARAAAQAGVRRFVYLSSIKVNGEGKLQPPAPGHYTYSDTDFPQPIDPYGLSKWQAEQGLWQIAQATGLEVVILRPPLVYGPGVKANFQQLLRIIHKGILLPLGAIQNRRSLVYVENLADAIITATLHPAAINQTFLVSDGEDLSTPQLIQRLASCLGHSAPLLPIPPALIQTVGQLTGKTDTVSRLLGSLSVDSSKIRQTLNWQPPYTLDQGLQATADWFLSQCRG
jgi:nucleoside-diphosphate-sugar epimerase